MCIKNWNKDISINVCITRMCGVPNNDGGRGGLGSTCSGETKKESVKKEDAKGRYSATGF
jgi:hypothetical protein